ncbi:glycosyltransferase family 4 protein [Paenibacillus sp. 1P07SE]|uniref:glycosyltransferase family 4 protein n=1 Tax=Paenibacillus sp. 1P07SE TaxID=3132209 RepID=UPI0039A42A8C
MKVIQIVDEFSSAGGMERFIYDFSVELLMKNHEVCIMTLQASDYGNWGNDNVEVNVLGNNIHSWKGSVETYSPDLIVWHATPHTATLVEELSHIYKVACVIHGVVCPSGSRLYRDRNEVCKRVSGSYCLVNWYMRQCGNVKSPKLAIQAIQSHRKILSALMSCREVYAVSNAVLEFLVIEGINRENIVVFDNSEWSLNAVPPLKVPKPNQKLNLLYVGRLVYSKGVQFLIEAVQQLVKESVSVHCYIIGDGWYHSKLKVLVHNMGLQSNITFLGKLPRTKVETWYENTDIVVVPSIWPEPAGLVVPEARRMGKPVIVFESGGLPEWSTEMDGIFISKHADAINLAETIKGVLYFTPESDNHSVQHSKTRNSLYKEIMHRKDYISKHHKRKVP